MISLEYFIGSFQLHLVSCSHCFCVHSMHECRSNNHKEKKLNEGGNGSHEINLAIKSQSATSSMNKYKQYVLWGYVKSALIVNFLLFFLNLQFNVNLLLRLFLIANIISAFDAYVHFMIFCSFMALRHLLFASLLTFSPDKNNNFWNWFEA